MGLLGVSVDLVIPALAFAVLALCVGIADVGWAFVTNTRLFHRIKDKRHHRRMQTMCNIAWKALLATTLVLVLVDSIF